jgi:hypothetical protein
MVFLTFDARMMWPKMDRSLTCRAFWQGSGSSHVSTWSPAKRVILEQPILEATHEVQNGFHEGGGVMFSCLRPAPPPLLGDAPCELGREKCDSADTEADRARRGGGGRRRAPVDARPGAVLCSPPMRRGGHQEGGSGCLDG